MKGKSFFRFFVAGLQLTAVLILGAMPFGARSTTYYKNAPYGLFIGSFDGGIDHSTSYNTLAEAIAMGEAAVEFHFTQYPNAKENCAYERTQENTAMVWDGDSPLSPPPYLVVVNWISPFQESNLPEHAQCHGLAYNVQAPWVSSPLEYLGEERCDAKMSCGNPINFQAPNKFQAEVDLSIGSLSFKRYYNSLEAKKYSFMGKGWRHTYSRSIDGFIDTSTNTGSAIISREDGKKIHFELQNSEWTSETRPDDMLAPQLDIDGSIVGWSYRPSAGLTTELYDAKGRLVSIRDFATNSTVSVEYMSDTYGLPEPDFWRVQSVTDERGRSLVFAYGSNGQVSGISTPDGKTHQYFYDSYLRLTSVQFPGETTKIYSYSEAGLAPSWSVYMLTGITDEAGSRYATFKYDSSERPIRTEHGAGIDRYSVNYASHHLGSVTITTPLEATEVRSFTTILGSGRTTALTRSCDGCTGQSEAYTFDDNGNLTSKADSNGSLTNRTFDTSRNLEVQRIEASNDTTGKKRTTQTDWHADLRVPTERRTYNAANILVAKSTRTYNTRGQALTASQIDPTTSVTRTATTTYCESSDVTAGNCPLVGLVTSVNGSRTDVADMTTYTYRMADDASCATAPTTCPYRKGDLWKVTNTLGQVTETLAYDGAGRALSVKDANGVVSDLEYHPRGWLTARKTRGANASVETDDAITRIEYWPTGLVKKVIQPDGAFTLYTYDAAHRLTDIADNAGNTIHYTLDNAGNRTQEDTKDPGSVLKRTLSRVYNQLGQLQTQADAQANPTDFAYDANGNTNTITDALGRVTDNDYDPLNRLSRTLQNVGGINAETKFQYDAQDNLTQVTDPKGLNTSYTYNGLGDLTQLASPDTGTTTYTYDSAGNRKTQTDARNQTSTYSYDALNRLTGVAYATSSLNVGYTYDTTQPACISGENFSTGRLTQVADASGTTQYCYDRFGNLVRKVQTTNGIAFTVRYAYTLAGQLSSVTYPDGAIASYVRDAQGRTTQVNVQRAGAASEVLLNQASYHPFGPVAGWTYGNGRQLLRPLNQNYQPTAVQDTNAGGLSVGFAYDPVGNLTQLTPAGGGAPLVKFDYDALSRLTTFKDGPTDVAIESYAYDATGNRQSFTNAAGTQAYTYPSTNHRLTQVGATTRSYDNAGNTIAIGGTAKEFVYDDTGRMTQVKQNAIAQRNYAYNGKGEQVRKYLGTASTYTVYDEAGHWLGDYDSTGAALQQAIWLDDLPVGLIANGNQLHYLEPDHLGTPRVVIEVARNVPVWTWDPKSEAFGNSVPNQDPDGDSTPLVFDMRFPGQRYDAASGLNYNYFRDYETVTGRYSKSDPIGIAGGLSTYGYSGSAPATSYDTYGLCWSNQRSIAHYYTGGGGTVSPDEIGCTSQISSRVQPQRNIWISKAKANAKAVAESMNCGTWKRVKNTRSVGISSGIFWIGGFSLLQDSNCMIQRNCGSTDGNQCMRDTFSYDCLLRSSMHDLFVNPSDFDNSANSKNPDFWDEYTYGGKPFHVDGEWYDTFKGGGTL